MSCFSLWAACAALLICSSRAAAQSLPSSERVGARRVQFRTALPASTPPPPGSLAPEPAGSGEGFTRAETDYQIILTGYQPNYFVIGFVSDAAVKFQLSLKLDLWPNQSHHSMYFGYTQKSIWDVLGHREGFVDSNYAPELFYGYFERVSDVVQRPEEVNAFLDQARLGLLHESNGRTDAASRSWNRVYGFVGGSAYVGTRHYLRATLQAWVPLFVAEQNEDITQYLGYGRIGASYALSPSVRDFWGVVQLAATYSHGWTLDARHALEVSLEWRPGYGGRVSWWRFTPNFFAQLYSGYGEYLLAYDERHTSVRVGISIEDRVYWVNGAAR